MNTYFKFYFLSQIVKIGSITKKIETIFFQKHMTFFEKTDFIMM